MRYVVLFFAVPLFACSAAQSEAQEPQIIRTSGEAVGSCLYKIDGLDSNQTGTLGDLAAGLDPIREALIMAEPSAAFECVTEAQDALNDRGISATIDDVSWLKMASVEAGQFKLIEGETDHPEAKPYDKTRDATADVDAALERAAISGNNLIIVMGANWCHDSRGLAGWFATPRFARMLSKDYEMIYVDVGFKDRNLDIAAGYGIKKIKGTPTVLVVSPEAQILNPKSAPTWRNAASRSEDDIFDYFAQFKPEG